MFPILGKCLTPSNIKAHQITNQLIIKWDLPATPTLYELRYREVLTESTRWTLVSTSRWESLENMRCLTISSAVRSTYGRTSTGCYGRARTTWIARRHSMQTVCRQISQRSLSLVLADLKLFGKEWLIVLYTKKAEQHVSLFFNPPMRHYNHRRCKSWRGYQKCHTNLNPDYTLSDGQYCSVLLLWLEFWSD